jgi:hypothetical protein
VIFLGILFSSDLLGIPTKPTAASRVQVEKSSRTIFEHATFRLTVICHTTRGKTVDVIKVVMRPPLRKCRRREPTKSPGYEKER